ncbi:Raslike protein 1, putative [Acanthamoeba castellanii str. Neff]|uniref:Raslike protein 1, putative n=1 Tax=Acanthamoeba castellanii (strain ATCC 30010 / Neff) TaxID=1257118 RepID=L8H942_ACACF|nr:Raslike protein 1, putative [Acanthamoeba castellanii str. Neff]ELR21747.1 Raslike protein 1, putative [Acanthamoeba castellanii str. Neff]
MYRLVVVGSGDPTLEDSYRKQITVDGIECVLDIIDTAGQDDFMAIRESYYKEGDGFLCVYDITSRTTFNDVEDFHDAILRVKDANSVPFMLVGNKADMEEKRVVQKSELEEKAKKLGCKFMETSAKSRQNETIAFRQAKNPRAASTPSASTPSEDKSKDKKKKGCVLI